MAKLRLKTLPKTKTANPRLKTVNPKPETGHGKRLRHPLLKADIMGPRGPLGTHLEIMVTKKKFDLLKDYDFVRVIVSSADFSLDNGLLLKDMETFLCLVPRYIPAVLLIMEKGEYEEKVNSLTVFRLTDGRRMRDYILAHVTDRKGDCR